MDSSFCRSYSDLLKAESSFQRACEQIVFLNKKLDELQLRYDRANKEGNKSFRYSLRLKIAAGEGLRNTYYEYACRKADLVSSLRCTLFGNQTEDMMESDMESDDSM